MTKAYNEEPVKMKVVLTVASSLRWEGLAEHIEGYKTTYHKSIAQAANTTDVDSASNTESASNIESASNVDSTLVLTDACTLDQLAEAIKNTAINTIVVFYQQAEHYLAEAVGQGASFDHAAEQWQRTINHLLQIQRKNRARLKLINIEQALAAPQALCEQLALLHLISTHELADSVKQDVTLLAACQYVIQSPELVQLNNLLQASSLLLQPDNKILVDVEGITDCVAAVNSRSEQLLSDLEAIKVEKAVLQKDLENGHQQNHKLSKLRNQDAQSHLSLVKEMQDEFKELKAKQQKLISELEESEKKNSLLLMQLHQVVEQLEKNITENSVFKASSKAEYLKLEQVFKDAQTEYELEQKKLSSEFAAISKEHRILKSNQKKLRSQQKENSEEKTLLLIQLQQLQNELERRVLERKRSVVKDKQQQREITKLKHKTRNITADLASKNYRLEVLTEEIVEMKESMIWKAGTPVRIITEAFGKKKKQKRKLQNEVELILTSEYFDAEWYLLQYPDVAESTISPAEHYLRFGAEENRSPSQTFSGSWYIDTYPDVATSGMNPLLHYVKFGRAEGRTASIKLIEDQSKYEGGIND